MSAKLMGSARFFVMVVLLSSMQQALPALADSSSNQDLIQAGVSRSNYVTSPYRLAPGDVLTFSIDEEPDFTQTDIVVRPDGYTTIPPVGQISVAGKKLGEVVMDLEDRLQPYVKSPTVYLTVKQFHIPKVYLSGAVARSGAYEPQSQNVSKSLSPLERNSQPRVENAELSVLNALINSGGVLYTADLTHVTVTSKEGLKRTVNLLALVKGADVSQDYRVEDGDTIFVPSLADCPFDDADFRLLSAAGVYPREFPVRIIGNVEKPGLYYVASDSPLLNSVIALASGYKPGAIKGSVQVKRPRPDNTFAQFSINPQQMDLVLRPNDVVEVKTSVMYTIAKGLEGASRMATPLVWLMRN